MGPSPSEYIYKTIPVPKAQRTFPKRRQKGCKKQSTRGRPVRLWLLEISEKQKTPTWLPKDDPNRNDNNRHYNM